MDKVNEYLWEEQLKYNRVKKEDGKPYHSSVYVNGDFTLSYIEASKLVTKYVTSKEDELQK